jgi:hypothetical protein
VTACPNDLPSRLDFGAQRVPSKLIHSFDGVVISV